MFRSSSSTSQSCIKYNVVLLFFIPFSSKTIYKASPALIYFNIWADSDWTTTWHKITDGNILNTLITYQRVYDFIMFIFINKLLFVSTPEW